MKRIHSFNILAILANFLMFSASWANSPWLSVGGSHVCMLTNESTVRCWGAGGFGQLGDGSTNIARPYGMTILNSPVDMASIVGGQSHSCALKADGNVLCWGKNDVGQLGRGTLNTPPFDSTPGESVSLSLSPNAIKIAAGADHTCAIMNTHIVRCWGSGTQGELGNGLQNDSGQPVKVSNIGMNGASGAIAIATGSRHSCALLQNKTVQCWGRNNEGQLGIGNSSTPKLTPVEVTTLNNADVIAIGASGLTTCALTGTGEVWCWGYNAYGQVGDNNMPNNAVSPQKVIPGNAKELAVGGLHVCARLIDGKVQCWGLNSKGQLGIAGDTQNKQTPTDAAAVGSVRYLAAGGSTTCARRLSDDVIICWGDNTSGQLGTGSVSLSNNPPLGVVETQQSINIFSAIALGEAHTCALNSQSNLSCWGRNDFSQLGNNQLNILTNVTDIAAGANHTCAINDAKLYCWGKDDIGQLGGSNLSQNKPVIDLNQVAVMATGEAHTCANHTVYGLPYCWGNNDFGQLGPSAVAGGQVNFTQLSSVSIMAAGKRHTCAVGNYIGQNGLYCWGLNDVAQLGNMTNATTNFPNPIPQPVANLTDISALAAGSGHTCAVGKYNGTAGLYCWGYNAHGQLGTTNGMGSSYFSQPQKADIDIVTVLAAGWQHTCGIGTRNGVTGLYCWGRNNFGQIGSSNTTATAVPVLVPIPGTVISVRAGANHTCALNSQGQLYCWGSNSEGQLGPSVSVLQTSTPTLVSSVSLAPNIMDILSWGWFEVAQ